MVAAALAAVLACVWVVPGLLDWNRYRDGIAALASQRLGRGVRIGGPVSLQLLPQPVLTAADVSVEDAGDGVQLEAKALRLRVALGPLLAGRIDARELVLQSAEVRLPWPPPAGALSRPPPAWITGLKAEIEQSRVAMGGLAFSGIEAALSTDPDTGTLFVAGSGQSGGRGWQFTLRLARPGGDHAAGLDISLDGQGPLRGTGGTFSGRIMPGGAVEGRVAGRGADLSLLMPAPAMPWRGDGRLNAAGGLVIADELSLEIGGAPARGAVALRVSPEPRLDLSIAAGRLDLDAWIPALLLRNPPGLRAGLPTGIDLSAEAATLAGGTLRRLRGAVDLGGDAVVLRDVSAVLPGNARLSLSGSVSGSVSGSAPATFTGPAHLVAPDLRATMRWLQAILPAPLAALPPNVLRTADLAGQVRTSAGEAVVSALSGTVDESRLTGSASIRLPAAPVRPATQAPSPAPPPAPAEAKPPVKPIAPAKPPPRTVVTADLTLDRLSFDGWVPEPAGLLTADAAPKTLAVLRTIDSDVRLKVGQAIWGQVPLGAIALDLQSEATRVVLRRLEASPFGSRLSISGQVSDTGQLSDGKLELSAPEAEAFQPLLAASQLLPPGLDPLVRGPATVTVLASGPQEALTGRLTVNVSDLRADVQPTINLPKRSWSGGITLQHPGAPRLLQSLGIPGAFAWLGDGSFSLVGQMIGEPGKLMLNGAMLAAGSLRLNTSLQLDGTRLTGQAKAETLPLPLVYPRSPDPLPLSWLQGWQASVRVEADQVLAGLSPVLQQASTDVTLDDGVLRLSRVASRLLDGSITAGLTVDAAKDPPQVSVRAEAHGLRISSDVLDTPVDLASGEMQGRTQLTAAGYSPAALLATMAGRAELNATDGVATGFDLEGMAAALSAPQQDERLDAIKALLLAGHTPFSTLDLRLDIERGVFDANGRLLSPFGSARITGNVDLVGDGIDLRLGFIPALSPPGETSPTLGLRLSGSASDPVRTPELVGLARWLGQRRQ